MQGKVNVAYRVWYTLKLTSGAPATGVAGGSQTITIRNPGNTATMAAPTVVEFGGGLYYFDISATFTNTHGAGQYGGTIAVSSGAPVLVDTLPVNVEFFVQDIDDSVWDESAASHLAAGSTGLQQSLINYLGAVWINANNGVAGTITGINGTSTNPVDTIADAITIADNTGIQKFVILTGTLTLTAALTEFNVEMRDESELLLNGQNINGTEFFGGFIKGAGTGTATMRSCSLEDISGLNIDAQMCGILGTIGLGPGTSTLELCHSHQPGTATPIINFTATSRLNLRAYSGGIEITNMTTATNIASLEYIAGQLIVNASCTAGTLVYRGNVYPVADSSAGTTVIDNSTVTAVDNRLSTVHGSSSWLSVIGPTENGISGIFANPGQTIGVAVQTLDSNAERVDGYVPQIDYVIIPTGTMMSGFPLVMTREAVGTYSGDVIIPFGITAIGTYIISTSWTRPGTALTQYKLFLVNVALAFGNTSVSPG